ncbi:hypothetical protein EDC56_2111 [Sinobacterium caligoides]|uniref:Patatin-like phospholipase n=1 Tax=Sinobacterium caligoides TaxID=933926 RepID=A0A3N2DPE5_9GAMM|nr:patatin-like phospholipase family protein [Sinobacterium caligoides]ROS01667.1 hypothetical protein EDC56_2111 [Sinobacterium caligoides]
MSQLCIRAGTSVIDQIRAEGLPAHRIAAVFAASGAAKWLTICGLDQAIFSRFLPASEQPIDLFGTSVGAFKLAAGMQADSVAALANLAECYIQQDYTEGASRDDIDRETQRILTSVLKDGGSKAVLNHSRYSFHCAAVSCRGRLASERLATQRLGMLHAAVLATAGRRAQATAWRRTVFGAVDSLPRFAGRDCFKTTGVALSEENIHKALRASGSIPLAMYGVGAFDNRDEGVRYRDGGVIDYHPLPDNLRTPDDGIVLYPHFYDGFTEGWFDKFAPWRKVAAARLKNVLMVSPSREFVASLPEGAIPDRRDFARLSHNPALRQQRWREAVQRSEELGDEFMALVDSGDIASRVEPFVD